MTFWPQDQYGFILGYRVQDFTFLIENSSKVNRLNEFLTFTLTYTSIHLESSIYIYDSDHVLEPFLLLKSLYEKHFSESGGQQDYIYFSKNI